MQTLTHIINGTYRLVLRIAMFVVVACLAVVLFCVALVVLAFVLLRALLTGRRPQLYTTFARFHQTSQQFNAGLWRTQQRSGDNAANGGTVIEGQAEEVRDDRSLPDK